MVSITTAILACVFGFMLYFLIPVATIAAPVEIRQTVGTFYLKLGSKALKQFTFVRRVLSGYDIIPIDVDDEQKLLEAKLSGSTLGENTNHRFGDPDNRIGRLFSKPVALTDELIPAVVDAELAEWGHWIREKQEHDGLLADGGERARVDPYVEAESALRLVDPRDFHAAVANDIDSERIKTAEKKTKQRFEKYNPGVDIAQTLRVLLGFAVGGGAIIVMHYVNSEFMGSGGPSGPPGSGVIEESLTVTPDLAPMMDMAVMLV